MEDILFELSKFNVLVWGGFNDFAEQGEKLGIINCGTGFGGNIIQATLFAWLMIHELWRLEKIIYGSPF